MNTQVCSIQAVHTSVKSSDLHIIDCWISIRLKVGKVLSQMPCNNALETQQEDGFT